MRFTRRTMKTVKKVYVKLVGLFQERPNKSLHLVMGNLAPKLINEAVTNKIDGLELNNNERQSVQTNSQKMDEEIREGNF